MPRARPHSLLLIVVVMLTLALGGTSGAAVDGWSIDLSGEIDGSASKVKPACLASSDGGPLVARATFKVGARRLALAAFFASSNAGSRTFAPTPDASSVVVTLTDASDPSAAWTSVGDGSATIGEDGRSGTVTGTLVGAQGDVTIDATFDCSAKGTVGGSVPSDEGDRDTPEADAPDFSGSVEATVSGHCSGSESGDVYLFGLSKKKVFGGILANGSYTCEGITVPTAGGALYSGTFTNNVLRLQLDELIGTLLPTWNCSIGRPLQIRIRDGQGAVSPSFTAPSGDLYECEITIE